MYNLDARQPRYNEFRAQQVEQLQDEAALLRVLIEEAARAGRAGEVRALTDSLGKIAAVHQSAAIRAKDLIDRQTVTQLFKLLTSLLVDALARRGFADTLRNEIVDELITEFTVATKEIDDDTTRLPAPARICTGSPQRAEGQGD